MGRVRRRLPPAPRAVHFPSGVPARKMESDVETPGARRPRCRCVALAVAAVTAAALGGLTGCTRAGSGGGSPASTPDAAPVAAPAAALAGAPQAFPGAPVVASAAPAGDLRPDVMASTFCKTCHPVIYAEHEQNTHGRAFYDGEARQATRGFLRADCIRCHTPRPIAETGIGRTPMARWTDLAEGNTCMSCHAKPGYDYAGFQGGPECRSAFEPRVGTVQDCATCHRIAGTPAQWFDAENGHEAGRVCIDCHMPIVVRPVAVGEPPRPVRSHLFPASRSESQLRKAYDYQARIEGDVVVVRITNKGAGHNFPTANRQRAVESLVVIKDAEGREVARSRMVCHYPYASELEPHQMTLPKGSQIPSGQWREHHVPLPIAAGTVECRLYFKTYRPIADDDPTLSRCLEERRFDFEGVTPSAEPASELPEPAPPPAATDLDEFFSPEGYANVVRPPPGVTSVEIPQGTSPQDLRQLVALLESHLPEARARAKDRLVALGPAAHPALIAALGHWSNETFDEAEEVLVRIGEPAVPALVDALGSDDLYVRCHAREVLARMGFPGERPAILSALLAGARSAVALDRRSSAVALGELADPSAIPTLRELVGDSDWDVVSAAAAALALLSDRDAVPRIEDALRRARYPETRRDLGVALAELGSGAGIPALIEGLGDPDPLMRQLFFGSFFAVTGVHLGYEPDAPEGERLEAIARLADWWARNGAAALRSPRRLDESRSERAWSLVQTLGGGTDTEPGGDDAAILDELVELGDDAVPALVQGLTFPPGFVEKRRLVCFPMGRIGSPDAAPYLAAALRDPSPDVAGEACHALELVGDPTVLAQLRRFQNRIPSLVGAAPVPGDESPSDSLIAHAARTRLLLGDEAARTDLVNMLRSPSLPARRTAIGALVAVFGEARGYDPEASPEERLRAAQLWGS